MGFASYLLRDWPHDWWEEVDHSLGEEVMAAMSWDDFLTRFRVEFTHAIEVQ